MDSDLKKNQLAQARHWEFPDPVHLQDFRPPHLVLLTCLLFIYYSYLFRLLVPTSKPTTYTKLFPKTAHLVS